MKNVAGVVLAAALLAGATRIAAQVNYTHADRYAKGLVVCLSGAGGMMGETARLRDGLHSGGVHRAIEVFEWSAGSVLTDQTAVEANHRKARQLARRIEDYMRAYPGRPVHLIGVSAGTGLVVWALEDLGDGRQATGAILISSSLDTKYDLTRALGNVSDHLYSFNSVADTILSLTVTWAGTVDRSGGLAGGLVGFGPPDGASDETKALYKEKLVEISWWPGDVVLGHIGDHLGATSPAYVKAKIAPLVLGNQPPEPSAPKEAPDEAVEGSKAMTPAYAERLEKKRKADKDAEAKKAETKKQADEARKVLESKKQRAPKQAVKKGDKDRFFNWHVRTDADRFLREPRRLP